MILTNKEILTINDFPYHITINSQEFLVELYNGNDSRTRLARFEPVPIKDKDGNTINLEGLKNDINNSIPELEEKNLLKTYFVYKNNETYPKKELAYIFSLRCSSISFEDTNFNTVIPAVELVYFVKEKLFAEKNPDLHYLGAAIFDNVILKIVRNVSATIGCSTLFLFAINDEQLISYYRKQLLFEEYEDEELEKLIVDRLKTNDNKGCKFLFQSINE